MSCAKNLTAYALVISIFLCHAWTGMAQNVTRMKWGMERSKLNPVKRTEKEQILIETLLTNYNVKQKPPGTVTIKFAMNMNQIINVIEKDQIFVLNCFIDHEWIDNRISWSKFAITLNHSFISQ